MKYGAHSPRACIPRRPSSAPTMHVVFLYDHLASGTEAVQFLNQLSPSTESPIEFEIGLWRFSELDLARSREVIEQAAATADVVVIALERDVRLRSKLQKWFEKWLAAKEHQDFALILLICDPTGAQLQSESLSHFLSATFEHTKAS